MKFAKLLTSALLAVLFLNTAAVFAGPPPPRDKERAREAAREAAKAAAKAEMLRRLHPPKVR